MQAESSQVPRPPTSKEITQLKKLLCPGGVDPLSINCAYIAVFDHYITDSPGYAGKLMSVVWDGSPSIYDVYVWVDGKIRYVEKE
jgi:hypothetical protein